MSGAVIANWVLGGIIFVLIVGGGVYAIVRHGKAGPNYREARRHYRAKDDPSITPLSDYVPSDRVAATDGLAEPQAPLQDASQNGPDAAHPSGDTTASPSHD